MTVHMLKFYEVPKIFISLAECMHALQASEVDVKMRHPRQKGAMVPVTQWTTT